MHKFAGHEHKHTPTCLEFAAISVMKRI